MNDLTFVGVDPAFRKGGLGVVTLEPGNKLFFIQQSLTSFLEMLFLHDVSNWVVCVENSNLTKAYFHPKRGIKGAIDVGKNMAASQLIYDICKRRCKSVLEVSPKDKGSGKWNKDIVKVVAKDEKHTINQSDRAITVDCADAYRVLLYGKKKYLNEKYQPGKVKINWKEIP